MGNEDETAAGWFLGCQHDSVTMREPISTRGSVSIPNWGTRLAGYFMLLVPGANAVLATLEESWAAWLVVVVVSLLLMGVRLARVGVRVDARGFISRDALSTTKLSWSEVTAFDKRGFSVRAQLADGAWKSIQIYGAAGGSGDNLVKALTRGEGTSCNLSGLSAANRLWASRPTNLERDGRGSRTFMRTSGGR